MNEVATNTTIKKVGEMLKSAREKKGLTLSDVYKFIKIHPKYLSALENNDYQVFSSPVHIKGFLKIYTKLLELNVDEVLAFFRREYDEKKMGKVRIIKPLENPKALLTPTSVIVFSTLILILLFFSYLFYQYRSYTGNPSLIIEKPLEDDTANVVSFEIVGRVDRDSSVFLNGQKLNVKEDGSFVTIIDLSEGINTLNFLAINKLGKETKLARTVIYKKEQPLVGTNGKISLEVSASKGSSVVSVISDGKKIFDGTMLVSTSRVFEASQSIKLKASNSGAISLKLNGEDLGIFGKAGLAKEQEFK